MCPTKNVRARLLPGRGEEDVGELLADDDELCKVGRAGVENEGGQRSHDGKYGRGEVIGGLWGI